MAKFKPTIFARVIKKRDDGFALPSVLLLVTILSLVAASVIALQYFLRGQAMASISKVKSEYAAESGITLALQELRKVSHNDELFKVNKTYSLDEDGSKAIVEASPWGMFFMVRSIGIHRKTSFERVAIVAEQTTSVFENALVFANPSHQLVLTGSSHIKGDVLMGEPGATIGNLRNYSSPIKIPIEGTIRKEKLPTLPSFDSSLWKKEISFYESMLRGEKTADVDDSRRVYFASKDEVVITKGMIPDSIREVIIRADVRVEENITARDFVRRIIVEGNVVIKQTAVLQGLVQIIASKNITVEKRATLSQVILFCLDSIFVGHGAQISAQIFAPKITIGEQAVLHYPSVLFASGFTGSDTVNKSITLMSGSIVEGFVGLVSETDLQVSENLVVVSPGARIAGALYSNTRVQLDGNVDGIVVTKDFYFYDAPTMYLGWLRSGAINRSGLSKGYLLPVGLTPDKKYNVLDWL